MNTRNNILNRKRLTALAGTTFALAAVSLQSAEAATVQLNGQPLATSVAPVQTHGHTLVPMRDIFQALGATVNWNPLTKGISARRDANRVNLQIDNATAMVNGRQVRLEQPPVLLNGATMVPLRFVSEAMGANVNWNGPLQVVSITTNGTTGSGTQVAGSRTIRVPAGAVVPVTLDADLSSATAKIGDRISATVRSKAAGDSEFPTSTRLEGVVTDVQAKDGNNPGVLGIDFRTVMLPDGRRVPLQASLISLDSDSVSTTTPGRIMAKAGSSGKNSIKVIGIGAGAGFVLGKLLKKNSIITSILGAAGGYLYNQKQDKGKAREAVLSQGTELGVRIDNSLTYQDTTGYSDQRSSYLKTE